MTEFETAAASVTRVTGVLTAAVVDAADGIVVAEATLVGGVSVDTVAIAALAASLVTRLDGPVQMVGLERMRLIHLEAGEGHLVVSPVSAELLLVAVARPATNLGLLRLALVDAAGRLR